MGTFTFLPAVFLRFLAKALVTLIFNKGFLSSSSSSSSLSSSSYSSSSSAFVLVVFAFFFSAANFSSRSFFSFSSFSRFVRSSSICFFFAAASSLAFCFFFAFSSSFSFAFCFFISSSSSLPFFFVSAVSSVFFLDLSFFFLSACRLACDSQSTASAPPTGASNDRLDLMICRKTSSFESPLPVSEPASSESSSLSVSSLSDEPESVEPLSSLEPVSYSESESSSVSYSLSESVSYSLSSESVSSFSSSFVFAGFLLLPLLLVLVSDFCGVTGDFLLALLPLIFFTVNVLFDSFSFSFSFFLSSARLRYALLFELAAFCLPASASLPVFGVTACCFVLYDLIGLLPFFCGDMGVFAFSYKSSVSSDSTSPATTSSSSSEPLNVAFSYSCINSSLV
mmetsp:Transcript_16888/g.26882  ORF Transcript_16888/g.26882 Transcript_16888/m.26882 type:complete len:395 (-) Transcript_16888:603-1787(-)